MSLSKTIANIYISPALEQMFVAVFLSTTLHLIGILGVNFVMPPSTLHSGNMIEVVLVQTNSPRHNNANYLAQANQEGGGWSEKDGRPSTPTLAPFPDHNANKVTTPAPAEIAAATTQVDTKQLTANTSSTHSVEAQNNFIPIEDIEDQGDSEQTTPESIDPIDTNQIAELRSSVASIQAEIDQKYESLAKKSLKEKWITSLSTRESKYAIYMDSWRRKVEKIGTLNYPEEAKSRKIAGNLILDVSINANGTIRKVEILKSSGKTILDNAALRIIHQAAPFPPFSTEIRKEIEVLHITRTWEFVDSRLTTHK
jgi:periplasmic protein TonB